METNTCPVCASLDGRTITANEKATTPHNPQKHINCRCIWVRIPSSSGDYRQIEVSGIDNDKINRLDMIQKTPKDELVRRGLMDPGSTKKQLLSRESGDLSAMSMLDAEERIRGNSFETVIAYDKNGKYITSAKGGKSRVVIPPEYNSQLKGTGAVVTHNHPSGSSFSPADIMTASLLDLGEIRAVGTRFTYSMKPGKDGWPSYELIDASRRKIDQEVIESYRRRISDIKMDNGQFILEASHEANKRLAAQFGMIYRRSI